MKEARKGGLKCTEMDKQQCCTPFSKFLVRTRKKWKWFLSFIKFPLKLSAMATFSNNNFCANPYGTTQS